MYGRALKAIEQAGIAPSDYDHYFVVVRCQGGANAAVPGNRAMYFGLGSSSHAFLHEFGHNLGVHHPRTYIHCPQEDNVILAPDACEQSSNITDSGDPVGGGFALYPAVTRVFSGWMSPEEAVELTQSGVFRLAPLGTEGPQMYSIRRPGTNQFITLEFRQPIPPNGIAPEPPYDFPEGDNRSSGLWIRYSTISGAVSSMQLNAAPEDASLNKPTLLPDHELHDNSAGIKVRTCHAGVDGAIFTVAVHDEPLPNCDTQIAAPVISIPAPGSTVLTTPVIAGSGIAGAKLTVARSHHPEETLAETTVDARGRWRALVNTPLPEGNYSFSARQKLGHIVSPWGNNHQLVIKENDIGPLVIQPFASRVSKWPTVRGTGTPGAEVEVSVAHNPGARLGQTTVDENGQWAVRITRMSLGSHSLAARQKLNGVWSVWSANHQYNVAEITPTVIETAESHAISQATITGTAFPEATVVVAVSGDPGNLLGHSKADASGHWRLELDGLESGRLSISARAYENRASSSWSANKLFTVQ
jgi:hypothetical protein